MYVRIKHGGVLVPCERGVDGEYVEEGVAIEDAFARHGKWIDPMQDPQRQISEGSHALGVRALDLQGGGFGNGTVRKLAHILKVNTTVTRLNLAWNAIGNPGATFVADSLAHNRSLLQLDLSHNEIGDIGARRMAEALGSDERPLRGAGQCAALEVHGDVGAQAWYQLDKESVPCGVGNVTLRSLSLDCNPIEAEGRRVLLASVSCNGGLQSLSLGGGIAVGRDAVLLGQALWCNCNLTSLRVEDSHIGVSAARELAKVIARPRGTLRTLNLARNKLGSDGAAEVANSLKPFKVCDSDEAFTDRDNAFITEGKASADDVDFSQPSLTELNLMANNIGREGLISLASALHTNASLQTLILSDNQCHDEGGLALAEALLHNTSIQSMYFYDNTIKSDATHEISQILKGAPGLRRTDMVFGIGLPGNA